MQIRPVRAGIAVAVLASAALVGAAPLASAAPNTVAGTPCQVDASLTGLSGKTLVAGGAPLAGHVAFTNVSGQALSNFAEILTAGRVPGGPNDVLKIQGEHGGKWITLPYTLGPGIIGFHIASPGDNHLAAGNVDQAPLLISVPKGTTPGTYVLVATSLGSNIGPAVAGHAVQGLPSGINGCHGGVSIAAETFKVVASAGKPSSSPSASASTSAPAAPATPSASPSSKLAETGGGSSSGPIAGAAAALIALGAGALVVTRRRRRGQHS